MGGCEDKKECKHGVCEKPNFDKWKYTLYTTVIFLIVVSPYTYQITNKLFSKLIGTVASVNGSPTTVGIVLHAVVFTLLLRGLMELKI